MSAMGNLLARLGRWLAGAEPRHEPAADGEGGAPDDGAREGCAPGEADDGAPMPDDVVVMPIEDSIDLHTFAPRDIPSVVEEYLHEAQARGFREVRVIHGKGKGVQRRIVQGVLGRHPAVESFRDAPGSRGGWGATVVVLRR